MSLVIFSNNLLQKTSKYLFPLKYRSQLFSKTLSNSYCGRLRVALTLRQLEHTHTEANEHQACHRREEHRLGRVLQGNLDCAVLVCDTHEVAVRARNPERRVDHNVPSSFQSCATSLHLALLLGTGVEVQHA